MTSLIQLVGKLAAEELFSRYWTGRNPVLRSHLQVIWLMAAGKSVAEYAASSGLTER